MVTDAIRWLDKRNNYLFIQLIDEPVIPLQSLLNPTPYVDYSAYLYIPMYNNFLRYDPAHCLNNLANGFPLNNTSESIPTPQRVLCSRRRRIMFLFT